MNKQSPESAGKHRRKRRRKRRRSGGKPITSASITNTTTTISIPKLKKVVRSVLLFCGSLIVIAFAITEYQKYIASAEISQDDSRSDSASEKSQ